MEFQLQNREGAYPCEVTIDDDNGRYMIRKEDTSGEVFNSPLELYQWIQDHWKANDFKDEGHFNQMMVELEDYLANA